MEVGFTLLDDVGCPTWLPVPATCQLELQHLDRLDCVCTGTGISPHPKAPGQAQLRRVEKAEHSSMSIHEHPCPHGFCRMPKHVETPNVELFKV